MIVKSACRSSTRLVIYECSTNCRLRASPSGALLLQPDYHPTQRSQRKTMASFFDATDAGYARKARKLRNGQYARIETVSIPVLLPWRCVRCIVWKLGLILLYAGSASNSRRATQEIDFALDHWRQGRSQVIRTWGVRSGKQISAIFVLCSARFPRCYAANYT